jgi:nucleoside-diphosphate-sugar epimerase
MKNIIITGATGFVGSNLVRFLLKKNFKIFIIIRFDSDLVNLLDIKSDIEIFRYDNQISNLIDYFSIVKPITVFHLASHIIVEHESNQIDSLIQSNITFGIHLLEAMKETGIKNLINTGTSWQHYNNEDYNPVCLYAATKQAFESLIEYYVQAEDFKVITLKLFDTYGETDTRPKLINLLNKFADENIELNMTPGEQFLNLVHIDDVCEAFYVGSKIIDTADFQGHNSFAISSEKNYKLKEVIELFENVSRKEVKVIWGGKPYRKREVMSIWENGLRLPNWKTLITLEKGLSRYKRNSE